jgi:hypothetical protein
MAVLNGGGFVRGGFGSIGTVQENIAEAGKRLANAGNGIFSNFSPQNGNQISLPGSIDPKDSRLLKAGFLRGSQANSQEPSVQFGAGTDSGNDWRVRISVSPSSKILYWDPNASGNTAGLVAPLKQTDGFIFPYVPNVTVTHTANYQTVPLTHSNYAQYFYESSAVSAINISGDFTVQNIDEARYFLAGLYFFRAATKMFYGASASYQGSPPPIVYLDGYGQHYLPHVACVVTSFSHTMPNDVDYLEVSTPQSVSTDITSTAPGAELSNGSRGPSIKLPVVRGTNATDSGVISQTINNAFNRVPTASTFTLTLQPIVSRSQAGSWSFDKFARGELIVGKSLTGGFL